jgi:hypothetical protein
LSHSLDRRDHVLRRGRKAKAEAHPVAAMVSVNVDRCERRFNGRGVRRAEAEKVAVGGAIAARRDDVGVGRDRNCAGIGRL